MPAPQYQVSSYCHGGNCVAVAALPGGHIALRDHKTPDGPVLTFTREEWDAFLAGVHDGEFDRSALARHQEIA